MADKYTPLIVAALGKAAATPIGACLYGSKTVSGLFPNSVVGRVAATRAVTDGLLIVSRGESKGKEAYSATEKGLSFLLDQSNPKAVLEDLVRGLEVRQVQMDELLTTARGMTAELTALKATVSAVLPATVQTRMTLLPSPLEGEGPGVRGGTSPIPEAVPLTPILSPSRAEGTGTMTRTKSRTINDTVPASILSRLADWSSTAGAGQDCPLPDLYRSLTVCDDLTVGRFHDGLRSLHAAKKVYLHPWTGPLYALPEPAFALLVGHEVAYYASLSTQWSAASGQKTSAVSDH